jgi:hypothetical protein
MRVAHRIGVAVAAVLSLCVGAARAEPPTATNCAQTAPVCAVKAGTRQSYWNACQANRDGAIIVLAGECPAYQTQTVVEEGAVACSVQG